MRDNPFELMFDVIMIVGSIVFLGILSLLTWTNLFKIEEGK